MKKTIFLFLHHDIPRGFIDRWGINYLKKKFNLKIFDVANILKFRKEDIKKNHLQKINTLSELEEKLSRNQNSICIEIGYSFSSFFIRRKIKKYNSLIASLYTLGSLPYSFTKKNIFQRLKLTFNLLFFPKIFFFKLIDFVLSKLKIFYDNDIVFYGGTESNKFPGFDKARYKIYASSLDYSNYLKNKKKVQYFYKQKYALFIDTYVPFHPDNNKGINSPINPEEYFKKMEFFFKEFEKITKLKIIIALHPKADLKKYPVYIKRYKIIRDETNELIKYSKIVLHHGSSAQSFSIIYKKPTIILTSNQMQKNRFATDTFSFQNFADMFESKIINVDDIDYKLLSNRKKLFYFNKSLYKTFFSKYLKHPKAPNKPWYEIFYGFTKRKSNLFS